MKTTHYFKILSILTLLISFNSKAQDTLTVYANNQSTAPDFYYNRVELNGEIQEYGIGQGSPAPAFMVMVFDPNCSTWDVLPFETTADDFQPYSFFKFEQNDPVLLNDLDSLINNHLPDDHPFVILTTLGYDGPAVEAISPQLAQTFTNFWGAEAIETSATTILFGIMGHPTSFAMDTIVSGNEVVFSTTICPHVTQTASIEESQLAQLIAKPNPSAGSMTIEFDTNYEFIEITDLSGRIIRRLPVSSKQVVIGDMSKGQYLTYGVIDSQKSDPIRIQFY
jgi:hypothetical protein